MFNLTGKMALVTGTTGGIGASIAKALHGQGATVGISGRNEEKLKALAAELGDRVFVLPADLSSSEAVDKLVADAEAAMGQIDILVNNAGLTRDNLSMRMKEDEWNEVIAVNMTATFRLAKAVQRGMMKRRWGRNITVNCVAPGFIATAMTEVLTDDQKAKISATIPMGRMGASEDIAAAVTYLASEEAGYVTGTTMHVNGGMAMI